MASRGCGCGVCFCLASRCLFRGSNQLLLVCAFLRTADHPRQVSSCAVGTEATGDHTGPRDLSVPFALVAQCPAAQKETLVAFNNGGPWGRSHPCVCVCACVHTCARTCVCACRCVCTWTCVCARGPVSVCSSGGLKGKGLYSLVSGEPGDQPVIELQDGYRGLGVGVGVGPGEARLLSQGCPALPSPRGRKGEHVASPLSHPGVCV